MGDFNTPLTPMDRSTEQKINKKTQTLNDTMDHLDLIDIYRTFHPKTINFTFFSNAHGTFSRIDDILGEKSNLGNFKIIVGDFNTPLTAMDRSTKQKINKETQTLSDTMDQLDLIDIYRTFHPKTVNFTFFSSAHGTFS